MSVFIPEADEIYFSKTREYFQEVLSSYAAGNYRSAVVMLYSVAICDILFKLQELKDMYNDTVATEILAEVEKCRNEHDNKSKSRWEKELIEHVYKKTELLDLEAYTNLNHLFDHRNFSAHPALNENYELISPSQETTIAHIKNILNGILIKPPIFIKNIIETLTEDLKEKKENYLNEYELLSAYLNNKYYKKMPLAMKIKTFRALWKFCFCLPENEDCMSNLSINRKALQVLTEGNEKVVTEYIKAEKKYFSVAINDSCTRNLAVFLSRFPEIYKGLDDDVKLQIDALIEKDDMVKAVSWFKAGSLIDHTKYLQTQKQIELDRSTINYLFGCYNRAGMNTVIIDFFIEFFGYSRNFDSADERFDSAIHPYLSKMNREQYVRLIQVISDNGQIHNRRANWSANNKIVKSAKDVLGSDFNYDLYPSFLFDKELIAEDDSDAQQDDRESEIPF